MPDVITQKESGEDGRETNDKVAGFRLLYPYGTEHQPAGSKFSEAAITDLGLDEAAIALSIRPRYRERTRAILLELPEDPA